MLRLPVMIAFIVAGLSVTSAVADESLVGMPPADDLRRPGAIVLHGGGRITNDVFDRFIELAGGRNASIVFVPSAGFRLGDYNSEAEFLAVVSRRYSSWANLERAGDVRRFRFLYTDDPDDADKPEFVKPLETATGIWFSGGAQSRLNYRYVGEFPRKTKFQELVRRLLERGGVVGGTSAGTAVIPEIMTMWEERDDSGAPPKIFAAHGLGLFDKAIVEQHFEARGGRLERFTGLLRDNVRLNSLATHPNAGERMIGIGVEEPSALVIRGNHFSVLGNGSAHLFLKSNVGRTITWHELKAGESAQLRRNAQQDVTLGREELILLR
ncbi:MAG: hypothetical protein JWP89_5369 [Schlesneria sp.]|nr:hypothetical protein [Schlesneria sp.]